MLAVPTQALNGSASCWIVFFSPVKRRLSYLLVGRWPAKTSVSAQGPASKRGSSKIHGPSLSPQVGFTLRRQVCLDQIGFLFLTLGSLCWHLALSVNLKLSMQFVFLIYLCASCAPQGYLLCPLLLWLWCRHLLTASLYDKSWRLPHLLLC